MYIIMATTLLCDVVTINSVHMQCCMLYFTLMNISTMHNLKSFQCSPTANVWGLDISAELCLQKAENSMTQGDRCGMPLVY